MDIYDKARELGIMLSESEELVTLKKCEAELESDSKSIEMLSEFKRLQDEMMEAIQSDLGKEVIEERKNALMAKQKEINEYEITMNFFNAKAGFESLMKQVNDIIAFLVKGEEGCSADSCASCSGCGH